MSLPKEGIVLMDGGFGHELKERKVHEGMDPSLQNLEGYFLPGAFASRDRPEAVRGLHAEYIQAGARVITTNNFVATPHTLEKVGRGAEMATLIREATCRAREAVEHSNHPGDVIVAGCVPPLCESYQTEGLPPEDEMRETYAEICCALQPNVDVLLCETLSTRAEARAAAAAASETGKPVWLSFTIQDDEKALLRSGEPLSDAVKDLKSVRNLQALLLNCSSPSAITAGLATLRGLVPDGLVLGAYANGFQVTTTQWLNGTADQCQAEDNADGDFLNGVITEDAFLAYAEQWVAQGARIIGGCCSVGPSHIARLAQGLGLSKAV